MMDTKIALEKHVGERMRKARLDSGYTQSKLAELLGVQSSTLSHWEHGLREPSFVRLAAYAKATNVTASWLFEYPIDLFADCPFCGRSYRGRTS